MKSIKNIYKIGNGPSSSHTMGPMRAAVIFKQENPNADKYRVNLYGSLAATGDGHLTLETLYHTLAPTPTEIVKHLNVFLPFHSNGMKFEALNSSDEVIKDWVIYSVGGGDIAEEGQTEEASIYEHSNMTDILKYCESKGLSFWEYVQDREEDGFWEYLREVWIAMKEGIERGIEKEGLLPGGLHLQRKASTYNIKASGYKASLRSRSLIFSYALATAEENASGGVIVTAPTCGSSGVLPAVLYHCAINYAHSEDRILKGLATAGLIASIVKKNASVSGAEVGCQGEIGVACSMAAAAANQIFGGSIHQIEYAAEMGLEHHLGLTCDPVCGLVQIPCIERNAFASVRAFDANMFSMLSDGNHRVSFDRVVEVMKQTGRDLPSLYKETSQGGLASISLNS